VDTQQLKDAGLKVTMPRMKILTIFENNPSKHFSAELIYKLLTEANVDIGLATVYRVLAQFESAGILEKHYFDGEVAVYELKQERHHDHLVCMKCNKVVEFIDDIIEERQTLIAKNLEFTIVSHALTIYGLCIRCQ
jgi:Fur family ferric uptake transcriptional regulator